MSELICPYSGYSQDTLQFCEERLCSWIVSPSETWSNLAYLIIGILIIFKIKNLKVFGYIAIAVGISSFIYHATHLYWTETLDLMSMNLLGAILITFNFKKIKKNISEENSANIFLTTVLLSSLILLILKGEYRLYVFGGLVTLAMGMELVEGYKNKFIQSYKWLFVTLGFFILSFVAWNLDYHKIVCDPKNHFIQGHALWHILNSVCFYTLAKYYQKQMDN